MPVMKAKAVPRTHQTAIVMDLSDLEREASTLVSRAQAEADRIVAEARANAERESIKIREDAREAGKQEGYDAGYTEGQQRGHDEAVVQATQGLQNVTARWAETLDLLQANLPAHVADAKTDLIRLALAIAERVTHLEALRNRQVAPATVEATLRLVGSARMVSLSVHPEEIAILENYLPDLLAKIRTIESVELLPDEAVKPGGCIIQFGAGQVDAQLETQLARIADELLAGDGNDIAG